jgi:hypothetical protein
MTTTYDQFSVAQEKTLAKLSKLNAIGTSTGSKFVELNMAALKENSSKVTQAADVVAKLKNVKSMEDLQVTMQPTVDVMTNYWKASVGIANNANTELSKLFEDTVSESNSVMSENLDALEKNAFPGAQVMASAIKTTMSFVNQTFDTAAKVQRQAQEAVNTTLASGNKTAKSKKKN